MYSQPYYNPYHHQGISTNMSTQPQQDTSSTHNSGGKIVVHGEGIITSPPDNVSILLGAVTEAPTLEEAQQDNASRISSVISALNNLGISEEDIQTTDYRIEIQYDYIDGKQTFRGYQVIHLLNIILQDVNATGRITDAAVSAGANTVRNIQFSIQNSSVIYQEALIRAVNDGKTKAESIASNLHVTLHAAPIKVEEMIQPEVIPFRTMSLAAGESTPIQPGTLQIKALVEMTFTYS